MCTFDVDSKVADRIIGSICHAHEVDQHTVQYYGMQIS